MERRPDILINESRLFEDSLKDMKNWGMKSWINYGIRLGFFLNEQEVIQSVLEKLIPWLIQQERYEECDWIKQNVDTKK